MHVDGHTLSQPRFLPLFTEMGCLPSPALRFPPCTGLGVSCTTLSLQSCLRSLLNKMPFSPSLHHHAYSLCLGANSLITQTIRMLKLDSCLIKVIFLPLFLNLSDMRWLDSSPPWLIASLLSTSKIPSICRSLYKMWLQINRANQKALFFLKRRFHLLIISYIWGKPVHLT